MVGYIASRSAERRELRLRTVHRGRQHVGNL